ncbi:hypothetical protein ACO0SA_000279 [Hanseniaspora valbyensis]
MPLIKEANKENNITVNLTGFKYKCIKTTLSTSEKAFINVLRTNDSMLKPTGQLTENIELQLPYWDNQDYKIPILPYDTIFEVLDKSNNVALCFNVVIHESVNLLDSEDEEKRNIFIDWCYQVLELKFDLQFFFNRWEGKIMKNLKFKKFNDSPDESLEFVLEEEEKSDGEDDEVKNILVSKALLDEEQEAEGEDIIINGFGNNAKPINKGFIQEVEVHNKKPSEPKKLETNKKETSPTSNKISNDLNF